MELTLTPSGTYRSRIISPPLAITRGWPPGAGGYNRKASSSTASMYDKCCTLSKSISSSDENAERTSAVSFASGSGFCDRKYVAADKAVAVVSDPALINVLAWEFNSRKLKA